MDIDTTPPSMHLELPTDEVMMEVEDFSTAVLPANAPPSASPVVVRVMEGTGVAAMRSVPTPPAVQITTSDAQSCPKVKLDEFFVRFIAGQDNHNFLTVLLDDARAGKDISNSPAYRRFQHAHHGPAAHQPPGSPVSRLINAHTPFGEMSPRSPGLSSAAARSGIVAAPLASDLDLGRVSTAITSVDTVPAHSPLSTRNLSLTASPESAPGSLESAKGAKVLLKSDDVSAASKGTTAVIGPEERASAMPAEKSVSPTTIDTDMASDTTAHSKPVKIEVSRDETMTPSVPNGAAPGLVSEESAAVVSTSKLQVSPASSVTAVQLKAEASILPEAGGLLKKEEGVLERDEKSVTGPGTTPDALPDSDAKMEPRDQSLAPRTRPPLQAPTSTAAPDAHMTEAKIRKPSAIPKFYFPIGRDAEDRERREREAIREFFNIQRTQKKIDGANKTDLAELVVEVVGVPSYFASLLFSRITDHYPVNSTGSVVTAAPTPEPMSADSMRSSGNDATMKDTSAVRDGDSTEAAAAAIEPSAPATAQAGAAAIAGTPNSGDASSAQQQPQSDGAASAIGDAPVAQNGVSVANGSASQTISQSDIIREDQFQAFYDRDCAGRAKEERLFRALLEPGSNREYLIPADFKPLLRALLICHQGLAFLHATPEFQHRYSETVIERIYFGCTRRHNGRLTLNDIKRSKLLETLMVVDEEEDINRERKYFSYEHFYVLYCRFWELDTNHDLQIDREDLMRYGGHSLTFRIVDRIFGGHARPLDSPENNGFMSYTDFIWFCLSEEDKTSETAIDYWFRCVDRDGDGLITMYDMEFFYEEQLHRMECFGHEPVQIRDILCQLLDMIKPNAKPPVIRRRDLKKCKLAGNFFNILFNLNKFFALEARDPLQIRQEHATPELTDWDRFAALEYLRLSAEEEGDEEEDWNDVAGNAAPLMAGEAPF